MQFNQHEMKLIERLRKQERQWPRTRWFLLGTAAFILAAYGYIAHLLFGTLDGNGWTEADSALLFAFFWPKVIMMAVVSGCFIGLAIRDWHGNVYRMLLLKILDERQNETGNGER